MAMTWSERIENYDRVSGFPHALAIAGNGEVFGSWVMGNDYRVRSAYHGGYPNTYLRRLRALFPDAQRTLHLFSGKVDVDVFPGDTADLDPHGTLHPTYRVDAHDLGAVPLEIYDLILADPPYSGEDADRYGVPMVDRNRVMRELARVRAGTLVGWLDQVLPMYRKDIFAVDARIAITRSTNHRFRQLVVFRRR